MSKLDRKQIICELQFRFISAIANVHRRLGFHVGWRSRSPETRNRQRLHAPDRKDCTFAVDSFPASPTYPPSRLLHPIPTPMPPAHTHAHTCTHHDIPALRGFLLLIPRGMLIPDPAHGWTCMAALHTHCMLLSSPTGQCTGALIVGHSAPSVPSLLTSPLLPCAGPPSAPSKRQPKSGPPLRYKKQTRRWTGTVSP